MPFTFAHPAIILPLTQLPKKWYSLTGLIVGSIIPDFEYFLRLKVKSEYSHTLSGLFWFDIPLAILISFLFHNISRNSLIDNLPLMLKSRLFIFKSFNWNSQFRKKWFIVIISVMAGATSHLLWDSFTHVDGYFVNATPALKESINISGTQIPVFKLVQHSSSIIGALTIILAFSKLPTVKIPLQTKNLKYWLIFTILPFATAITSLLNIEELQQVGNTVVITISAMLISLILTPFVIDRNNIK